MKRVKPSWVLAALIVLFGAYLRVVAVVETRVDHPIRADAAEYFLSAYNLVEYGVYSSSPARLRDPNAPLTPDSIRVPGLPMIIAPFVLAGESAPEILRSVQWVNVALQAISIALVFVAALAALPGCDVPGTLAAGIGGVTPGPSSG